MHYPLRILHIVYELVRGGMESRIMDVYRNIDRKRFQYDFYIESGKCSSYDDEVRKLGGRVFYRNNHSRFNIPNFSDFGEFLKEHKEYKIVYAYNQWSGFYLRQAYKYGVPVRIASSRTALQKMNLKNIIKNIVKLNVNKYATHRFAVSEKAACWLFGDKETKSGHINIWPNAIETRKFLLSKEIRDEVRSKLLYDDNFIIIHVGSIKFEKNHLYLLKVFAEVKRHLPIARLVLVGGGNFESLKEEIKELGIEDSVKYLGVRDDIPRLLQAGDVFVFPSLYEGFPGAVLEAETAGLPCFISDTITKEVVLTDLVKQLSIEEKPEVWAREILKSIDLMRTDQVEKIRGYGYDIDSLVRRKEKLYEDLLHKLNIMDYEFRD